MCIPVKDLKTLIQEGGADFTLWKEWAKKKGLLHTEKDGRIDPKTKSAFLGSNPRLVHIALPDDTDAPAAPAPTAALKNAQKEAEKVDIDKLPWGKENTKKEQPQSQGQQITMQDLAASEGGFVKIDTSLPCWEWDDATTAKMKKNQAMRKLAAAKTKEECARILGALGAEEWAEIGYTLDDPYESSAALRQDEMLQKICEQSEPEKVRRFLQALNLAERKLLVA